ncbi:hypothetical protein BS78_08G045100 [Paspalum vaginatum]|nr:hypothetical protein BS78_08G045100 [Paspalum vaginatum]
MEMDDEDEEEMKPHEIFEIYRSEWIQIYGKNDDAAFYKPTELPPMRCTDGQVLPVSAQPMDTMEIFFVKVASLAGGLKWPLDVYGDVAVRDSKDRMRNYLFRRDRDNCQTLTSPQDSLLELTGPSRAIILLDEPIFEIDLKVKGDGRSPLSSGDDKVLCLHYFGYNNIAYRGAISYARTKDVSSENCAMSFRFAHVKPAVEATIIALVTSGSGRFAASFTARTASIGEDVVLLDSRGQEAPRRRGGAPARAGAWHGGCPA